ncbi:MAG: BNR-repeat neuraminidase N-terminal domain-containing protein [Bacteroidota bacterium]
MNQKLQNTSFRLAAMVCLLFTMLLAGKNAFGQLTGSITVPSTNYSSIKIAIDSLNLYGVGTGGVTFNVAAGYTETLSGQLQVTATGTAANPIVFAKNGGGTNPVITAYSGTQLASSNASIDIMWSLVGSDYITINGIDLVDPITNTTATTQMEVGYGLYKVSATDGANNNTIKNCVVTLNRNNSTASTGPRSNAVGSVGIEVMACTPTSVGNIITVTSVSGASSNNKFYGNTIQNVNFGISLGGYAAPSPYTLADVNNDIGGSSIATGNTIINFGGGSGATAQCGAIFIHNQWSFNISYNNINNNNGAGINHPTSNRGIWLYGSSIGAGCDITYNKITINGGTSTSTINWCIDMEMAQSGANGNTINIKNNQFLNCNVTAASTAAFTAVWLNTAATTVNVTNNYFYGFSYAGTATSEVILSQLACGTLNILNNTIDSTVLTGANLTGSFYTIGVLAAPSVALNINSNAITKTILSTAGSATKTIYGIFYNSTTPAISISDNTINDISRNGTGGGTTIGIYHSGGSTGTSTTTVKRNTISNINVAGTGVSSTLYGIQLSGGTIICDSNTIFNLSCTGTAGLYGIYVSSTTTNENYNYNTIYNLSHLSTGNTYGIYTATTTGVRTVSRNTLYAISGGGSVSGIFQTSSVPSIFSNKIYNISTTSTSLIVSGITLSASTAGKATVYNNLISGLSASASNGGTTPTIRGIDLTSTSASTTLGVYHNTIYLNATSTGTNFSTAGVYHTYSATATSAALDMRNNIIVNTSTANGTGFTSAFRRSASTNLSNFNLNSNNNLFYSGTPSATNLIFYDGANADQTIADYKTRVTPREALSVTEVPNFLSTTGSSNLFLNIDSTILTQIEANGSVITDVKTDYSGRVRAGYSGYTGTSGLPDIGAFEGNYTGNIANQMIFDSANADQYTGLVLRGTNNVKMLRVRVYTEKGMNALQATAFHLTLAGSSSTTDIANTKIYYTASDSTFTNPQLFGSVAPASSYTISGSATLAGGANYFWVVYDISSTATPNNFVDAAVTSITISGNSFGLINGNPTGNIQVKAPMSGNYYIGVGYVFPTITSAINELTTIGIDGHVTLTLMDALYNASSGETFPIILNTITGASAVNTITIIPNVVGSTIESSNNTATIDFNGGSNFIIDGSINGSGGFSLGANLVISNTSTSAPAIRFINDASKNKILYTDLRGANTGAAAVATAGVVNFGTTTGTNGNDSNIIRFCDIHGGTTGLPAVGISSIGSATTTLTNNDNNRIENCNIYDFYLTSAMSAGIYVGANNSSWIIKKNHLYQTAKRIYTAAVMHRGFWITPNMADLTTSSGFAIDSNFIGGNASDGTGIYEMASASSSTGARQYVAMEISVGKGAATTVQGNTITNFNDSTSASTSVSFVAFNFSGGKINCNGNLIGSRFVNGAITFTTFTTTNGGFMVIRTGAGLGTSSAAASTDTINITNNIASGINLYGNSTTTAPEFFGFNISGGAKVNVINNLIGDTTLSNSINILSTSSSSVTLQRVSGVFANSSTVGHSYKIFNNTIANITNAYESATTLNSATRGIYVGPSVTGTDSVVGNTVKNIRTASRVKNNGIFATLGGIVIDAVASTSQVTSGNVVHSLVLTNPSIVDTINIAGIVFNTNTTGNNVVNGNLVHSLSMTAYNPYVVMNGLNLLAGNTTVTNNMISLGFDNLGSSVSAACAINGIIKNTGSANIYFNTVKIGGGGVSPGVNRTFAFQRIGAGTDDVRNNLFVNARNSGGFGAGHLAIGLNNASTLTQNNNIYRADSIGIFNSLGQQFFADWQTASTVDANSKDTIVAFVSNQDLHLATVMAGVHTFEGVTINGINIDFDGQTRSVKPYIGADEIASSPLPVKLLQLTARLKATDVIISWSTASENNNKGFEVERSTDGYIFEFVGFVKGAGNSNRVLHYTISDNEAFAKTNSNLLYYRLKQLDTDGKYAYSNSVKVSTDGQQTNAVSVYPNPFINDYTISLSSTITGDALIETIDLQGRLVGKQIAPVMPGTNNIPAAKIDDLTSGVYFVKVTINGETQVLKVMKR